MMPKDDLTDKTIIQQSVASLTAVSSTVEQLRAEMLAVRTASCVPWRYGDEWGRYSLGSQLMAELRDVTRFAHRSAVTAFVGVDPGANQFGTYEAKSSRISKTRLAGVAQNAVSGHGLPSEKQAAG